MKKKVWKKLTGRSLALLMAFAIAGSSVSYAATLAEDAVIEAEDLTESDEVPDEEPAVGIEDIEAAEESSETALAEESEISDEEAADPEDETQPTSEEETAETGGQAQDGEGSEDTEETSGNEETDVQDPSEEDPGDASADETSVEEPGSDYGFEETDEGSDEIEAGDDLVISEGETEETEEASEEDTEAESESESETETLPEEPVLEQLQAAEEEVIDATAYSSSNRYEITESPEELNLSIANIGKASNRVFYATFTVETEGTYIITSEDHPDDVNVSLFTSSGSSVSKLTSKPFSAKLKAGQSYNLSFAYKYVGSSAYPETVQLNIYREKFKISPTSLTYVDMVKNRTMTVTAESENGDVSYQWYGGDEENGTYEIINGATEAVYTAEDPIRAYYKCVVTDDATGKTKEAVFNSLTISKSNALYKSYVVNCGDPVTFDCKDYAIESVFGPESLTYQWSVKETGYQYTDIEGATESTYSLTETSAEMKNWQWRCVIKDGMSTVTTDWMLDLRGGLRVATSSGSSIHYWAYKGETVMLHPLAVTEMGTLTYTWRDGHEGEYYEYTVPEDASGALTLYCTISNGIDKDVSLSVYIHVMDPSDDLYKVRPMDFAVPDTWRDWYIVDQSPYSVAVNYWPYYKNDDGTYIKINGDRDSAQVYVSYEDGSSNYAGIVRTSSGTIPSALQKLMLTDLTRYEELNEDFDLPAAGDYTQYYNYLNIEKEQNVHIVKIGENGTKIEEGEIIRAETAGAESKDYGYYQFIPASTRIFEVRFSNVRGKGKARLYEHSNNTGLNMDPIAEADLDNGAKSVTCQLTKDKDYYIVVSGEGGDMTYDMVVIPYRSEIEIGVETDLNGATEFTAVPSESGYYEINQYGSGIKVLTETDKVINQFDDLNDEIYLAAGKKYYFAMGRKTYPSILLSKVEDVEYGSEIITGGRTAAGSCYWLIDDPGNAVFYPGSKYTRIGSFADPIPDAAQEQIVTLTFEEGITMIGPREEREHSTSVTYMDKMPNLVKLTLPSTVTEIRNGFLKNCPKLTEATIPVENSARWIGCCMLWGTPFVDDQPGEYKMLENIILDYIGENESTAMPDNTLVTAFHSMIDSNTETTVNIRDKAKYLGAFSLARSSTLSTIEIPGNVTEIQYCAFYKDVALKNVVIEEGTQSIEQEAFFACTGMEKIEIPKSVTWIGEHAIGYAYALNIGGKPEYFKNDTLPVIRCYSNSYALRYALSNELPFELIDGPIDISSVSVSLSERTFVTDGTEKKPELTIKYIGGTLKEGTDYTVTWPEDVINPGTKIITITGTGNFAGTRTINYKITEAAVSVTGINLNRSGTVELFTERGHVVAATVLPTGATNKNVIWTSSNEKVATVTPRGINSTSCSVRALTYGKATITATTEDGGFSKSYIVQTRFYDVTNSSNYWYKPVYWAADTAITKGYDGGVYFGPERNCKREEMITFLYRQAGQPSVSSADIAKYNKFSDVPNNAYYTKAVVWAAKNGITNGYSSGPYKGKFGVGLEVTREDTVTFLYRAAGKPAVSAADISKYSFPDVGSSKYYAKPIVWAAKNGITKGYSSGEYAGKFGVGLNVLRKDLITFLYRYNNL